MSKRTAAAFGLMIAIGAGLSASGAVARSGSTASAVITARIDERTVHFTPTLHAGFLRLHIISTGVESHHLIFLQLHPGVSFSQFAATAQHGSPFQLARAIGGNGDLPPGKKLDIWIHVTLGRLVVIDNPGGNGRGFHRELTISRSGSSVGVPTAHGIIVAAPGDRYRLPRGFASPGTWEFANTDNEPHEATIIRLAAGKTVGDLVKWAKQGEHGSPPINGLYGGFGVLGGHSHAWFTHGRLPAGHYALACFLPGPDGTPHLAMGMAAGFTVN